MTTRKRKQPELRVPRVCKICHQTEKRMEVGVTYTTIAPHLGICADCIHRYLMKVATQLNRETQTTTREEVTTMTTATSNTTNPYGDELCGVCHHAIDNQGLCVMDASHTRPDLEPSGKRKHTCIDSNNAPTGLFCVACAEAKPSAACMLNEGDDPNDHDSHRHRIESPSQSVEERDLTHNPGAAQAYAELDAALTEEDKQLIIGAIPLQTLPQIATTATDNDKCAFIYEKAEGMRCGRPRKNHHLACVSHYFVEPSPQPTPNTGEWRVEYTRGRGYRINDDMGCLAEVRSEKITTQIVTDHNVLPKLVDVLNLFLAMDNCNYELEAMRHSGLFDQITEVLAELGERGKRYGDRATLRTGK